MSQIATAYVQIEPTFKGVQGKIEQEMGGAGESGGKSFGSGFAKVLGGAGQVVAGAAKVTAGAVAAGSVAVAGLVKSAADSYANYEQLVGGAELLYGSAFGTVMANADSAFSRVQMSTNDYLETANGYATGLMESLGGDANAAAKLADDIIVAQADVVAATGNSAENVSNAFAGIMKNNFTMLDNLQLGIKPTKEGMQEVIDKMNELNGTEYEMGNLADMQSALVDYIDYVGMSGYAQNEASQTIQGSLASMSAAWQNLLTGMGDSSADIGSLVGNLVGSAQTFLGNMLPIIEQALMGVSTMISELAPVIAQELPGLFQSVLPMLLTAGADIIQTLGQGLLAAIPALLPTIIELVISLSQMLIEMLPQLLEVGMQVIVELAMGIAQALPTLIPTMIEVVLNLVTYLLDNIDLLIDAAIQLMMGLAVGLINAIPVLIEKAPEIIIKLVTALIQAAPKLLQAAQELIKTLANAIQTYWPQILAKIPQLLENLKQSFIKLVTKFVDVGKNIVNGIKDGIANAWDSLVSWFTSKIDGLVEAVANFLGIASPSKVFANEVGQWIPAGIAEGIQSGMKDLDKTVDSMTSDMLDSVNVSGTMDMVTTGDTAIGSLYSLLAEYLPMIARGERVNITLEGDMGRLFKAMQRESIRNTQLVGTGAVLSAT